MSSQDINHEGFLQSLFKHFSTFNFDKAKELADKEKDANKTSGSGLTLWGTLLLCISQVAAVEKLYMNLTFLTPKTFLRKESSVRLTYETILTELAEMEKRCSSSSGGDHNTCSTNSSSINNGSPEKISKGVLLHIRTHLIFFIQARLLMLSFYEKLISSSTGGNVVNYDEMLNYISEIIQKNSSSFHHPVLAPIKTTFTYECDIMMHLLGSLKKMQEWQFLPALLHLHDVHTKISLWQNMIHNKETKKYSFGSTFMKSSPLPALFQWLCNAKASFVSKFSFYFYETLAAQAPAQEMKSLLSKQSIDYVAKIQNFIRKADAQYVCLILEADGLNNIQGPGYHHPSKVATPLSGNEAFIAMVSIPSKPEQHWATLVRDSSLGAEKFTSFFDHQAGATYFLFRVEPGIILATIFETKKSEKESLNVKEFLLDLVVQLRCTKVFAALHQA